MTPLMIGICGWSLTLQVQRAYGSPAHSPRSSPGTPTYLFICLDEPVSLSKVKLWNYAKTVGKLSCIIQDQPLLVVSLWSVGRGVQDFSISVDDNMVYQGRLRKAPSAAEMPPNGFGQTVLFTNDVDVVQKEEQEEEGHTSRRELFRRRI